MQWHQHLNFNLLLVKKKKMIYFYILLNWYNMKCIKSYDELLITVCDLEENVNNVNWKKNIKKFKIFIRLL